MQPTDVSISSLVWQQFWQCSALVLTVWLICRLVRFRRSHLTCLLWLVVLLKFITPPVWDSSMGLFCWIQNGLPAKVSPSQPPDEPEFLTRTESMRLLTGDDMGKLPDVTANPDFKVTIHENETSRTTPAHLETTTVPVQPTAENSGQPTVYYSVKEIGVVIWMTVGLLIATVMLVRYLRCWHIIRRAGEQSHPELNRLLERLCSELKLKRRVRLLITHSRMGPAVIGLLRPTIILPTAITESRSLAELEPVLAHELIHSRDNHAQPTKAEYEKFLQITKGAKLATIAHPDITPEAERGLQSRRGMAEKNKKGGRPRKRTVTNWPQETFNRAIELRQAGNSLGEIAKTLNVPRPTVQSWVKRHLTRGV